MPHVHTRSQWAVALTKSLEYQVNLCFEREYLKQNTVARLKSNILTHPKFWAGFATAPVFHFFKIWVRLGFLLQQMNKQQTQNRR